MRFVYGRGATHSRTGVNPAFGEGSLINSRTMGLGSPSTNRPRIIEFASPRSFIRNRNSWMERTGSSPGFGEESLVNSRRMGLCGSRPRIGHEYSNLRVRVRLFVVEIRGWSARDQVQASARGRWSTRGRWVCLAQEGASHLSKRDSASGWILSV